MQYKRLTVMMIMMMMAVVWTLYGVSMIAVKVQ